MNTVDSREGLLDVVPFTVTAVATPFGMMEVLEEKTWFMLTGSQKQGV